MSDERCDLCGKLKQAPRIRDRCQASLGCDEAMAYGCKGQPLFSFTEHGADTEAVREMMRAPLLRAALAEALDIAAGVRGRYVMPNGGPYIDRIAELRAKFLSK